MKKSKFTETQIVQILKEADAGMLVKDVCCKHGISSPTYYSWKSKYGDMHASELKRFKGVEAENAKLKRMYADLALENAAMKELIKKKSVKPAERRAAVSFLVNEQELSVARSCRCVGLSRSAYYDVPEHWTVRDAEIIAALAELVEDRPSRGFWKCRKQLRRQGRP